MEQLLSNVGRYNGGCSFIPGEWSKTYDNAWAKHLCPHSLYLCGGEWQKILQWILQRCRIGWCGDRLRMRSRDLFDKHRKRSL